MAKIEPSITEHLDDVDMWNDTCDLFNHKPSKIGKEERIAMRGLAQRLMLFQAVGVLFIRQAEVIQNILYQADKMGLGKACSL